jgi:hypothetical protein
LLLLFIVFFHVYVNLPAFFYTILVIFDGLKSKIFILIFKYNIYFSARVLSNETDDCCIIQKNTKY